MSYTVSADGRGIARQFEERLNEAVGILGQYIVDGDADAPVFEMLAESRAADLVENETQIGRATYDVRNALKARCTNESTMYPVVEKESRAGSKFYPAQHVYLDIDGLVELEAGRSWGLDTPSLLFASLLPTDGLFVAGKREGMAVYFDPSERGNGEREPRLIHWNGKSEYVASDWDEACYMGVVRFFPSFDAMVEARKSLVRAISLLKAPVPTDAEEDDEVPTVPEDEPSFEGRAL